MHILLSMNVAEAKMRAAVFKALAHPVRILIVDDLAQRDRCVTELNRLVDIDESCLCRHLAILKNAGIVTDRREGMRTYYHLQTPCILLAFGCALDVVRANLREQQKLMKRL